MWNDIPPGGITLPRARRHDTSLRRDADLSSLAPRVPWDVFIQQIFMWEQGEHVGTIGTTGSGKTTLLNEILPQRRFVAVAATKPRDVSMNRLIANGYEQFKKWPQGLNPIKHPRRVIWPDATNIDSTATQAAAFKAMWGDVFREGGWCLVVDEGVIFCKDYKMENDLRRVWIDGRSLGVSQVVSTQRPRHIPLEIYSQSTHLFFWRITDENDLARAADLNVSNKAIMREAIMGLEKYQVLYVNTRTGQMVRTRPPAPVESF